MDLRATPGSAAAQKHLKILICVLGSAWLAFYVAFVVGLFSFDEASRLFLGNPEGLLAAQLATYSFIVVGHGLDGFIFGVLFPILWLIGLMNIIREELNLAGFVRLYSIGTVVTGGLLCLAGMLPKGGISGPWLAMGTVLGAAIAYDPHRAVCILGEKARAVLRRSGLAIFIPIVAAIWGYWELKN